ncbi:MAG: phytanoyl-CoA dioxygenase family protein [Candidatus Poribacteria bacterium]|nr:phytanoyl-CoA dioxygenase family protein [Candidatus Poribacteria bacterium]
MKLTNEQIEEFHTHGVLIAKNALTDEDLQPVIDEISRFIDRRALELKAEGKIDALYEDEAFERRYGRLFAQSTEIAAGLDIMHYRGRAVFEFLHNQNLLDVIESLIGPEIICNPIQHLRPTPPIRYYENSDPASHFGPWHQDAGVIMPEAEGSDIITCWLPLGDATVEMGCLEVLPDVIRQGYLRHRPEGGTSIAPDMMPEIEPVPMICCKGDLVLMSRFTPHRATPNRSDKCRWSMDVRYHPIGQHTGRTGHPDFVVRSRTNPDSVLTDHAEWCRLWIDAFENPRGVVMHRTD